MDKPTRFLVEWNATRNMDEDALDVRRVNVVSDDKADAVELAKGISREWDMTVQVIERTNIQDVTPPEDPPGLIWDWEEDWENVQDVTA